MHIKSLYLKNFRNYDEVHFEFGPRLNIVSGPNARGKTTVLEAIYLLMTGRSFRSSRLRELIKHEKSEFFIELTFFKFDVEQTLRFAYNGSQRKVFHNHTSISSTTSLIGLIPGTLMIPDDVSMIKGQPRLRRRYLDIQLAQGDPLYVHHLARYQKAMINRNFLLKSKVTKSIDVWEQEMARGAGYIAAGRHLALESLQRHCGILLSKISANKEEIKLEYKSQCSNQESDTFKFYSDMYKKMRSREVAFGSSLIGPHKDDLLIFINEKDARYFSSEGQAKSCVAAMRFAEWEYLRDQTNEIPLMLIDDLGVSLDFARRFQLLDHLNSLGQVFVTTTESVDHFVNENCRRINLT